MGFFSGWDWDGSKQRADASRANKQATTALAEGYGQQTQRYDEAAGMYDPYMSAGQDGANMYNALLGLRGGDEASAAYSSLESNPAFSGAIARDSNAVARNLNARGMGAGGTAAVAGERVFQENLDKWLNRYRDAGRQGFEATGQKANIRLDQGDAAYGYGATRAGQAINYGNALGATRNQGMNNFLGLAGTVIGGVNAFRQPPRV